MEGRKTRFAENESGIFSAANLDDPNHLEMAAEIRLCAQHFCNVFGRAVGPMGRLICPTGKSVDGFASWIVGWAK
jgi:hypothetical protein